MSSNPMRDPKTDHLLTPANAALVLIDYQPVQVDSINSMSRQALLSNVCALARLCKGFGLPIILTTVNGAHGDTVKVLRDILTGVPSFDRTTINAWEDKEFRAAVDAAGRKKLIMAALWTEACLSFPTLDAMREGFEVYPVVDAVGGTSKMAHKTALKRIAAAGAQLTSVAQVACELQRDWNRKATVPVMVDALFSVGAFLHND